MITDNYKVRCNWCEWIGAEEDLLLIKEEEEFIKVCPNCNTDNYLMDIPIEN